MEKRLELLDLPPDVRQLVAECEVSGKRTLFARDGRPVPWVRVYEIPSYVSFSHKAHLEAGATCQTCHGPVAEHERVARETDLSMTGCMDCHRANKASLSCTYCHEERKQ